MKTALIVTFLVLYLGVPAALAQERLPIIDMHLHAHSLTDYGGGVPNYGNDQEIIYPGADPVIPMLFSELKVGRSPLMPAANDAELMHESLAMLEQYNIWAVTTGSLERVGRWRAAAPERIIPAVPFGTNTEEPMVFRKLYAEGRFSVFAEISAQYNGLLLSDESLEPYFALAEELDIPVGVHLGEGPPGAPYWATPKYRAALGSPFQLEDVLVRHPRLRVYVMHYGSPLVDQMIAVLFTHPQVYVDVAANVWAFPREHFYGQLKRLIDAGFEKRIMFGSDQMVWPKAIELAIETIESAPFLNEEQKRDIFYNNAARFLRFTKEEMAKHHGE